MFHQAPLPRVGLIRTVVVAVILITLFAVDFSPSPGINRRVGAAVPLTAAPANDDFLNAEPILGASGVVFGTTVGATKQPLEQDIAGITGTGSVWYKWQAPFDGRFVFTTSGSSFNTLLGVYSGANLPGIQVRANDDDPVLCPISSSIFGELSRVSFDAVGGLVYHIAVDTKGTGGNIKLRWGRSATITVQARSISNGSTGGTAKAGKLEGDMCTNDRLGLFTYSDVPIGGTYTVSVAPFDPIGQFNFRPAKENGSTSPLTGDITLLFHLVSPTKSLSGRVENLPGPDITGLTVTCVSTNGALFSQTARIAVLGSFATFVCPSLPVNGEYRVTPLKLGIAFAPTDVTRTLFGDLDLADPFVARSQSHTISGRVTHSDGTTGISGVTIALGGAQTASQVTNTNGDYSFTVLHSGDYNVTPSNSNFTFTPSSLSFTNVTAPQTGNFSASFSLQLILDELGQVAALDSMLLMRDPFPVINSANRLNRGVDRNTRVAIFLSNFQLGPTEPPSSVVVNLVGSNNQTYDIPAEAVRPVFNLGFTQVIFRLPDTLTPGVCTLAVKAHGLTSNLGAMRIRN